MTTATRQTQLSMASWGAEPSSESTASLMLDLLIGTVFHTISVKSVILVFSSAVSKLNYLVEHTSLVLVSAPGRSVNSAIEMTVLLLLLLLSATSIALLTWKQPAGHVSLNRQPTEHPSQHVVCKYRQLLQWWREISISDACSCSSLPGYSQLTASTEESTSAECRLGFYLLQQRRKICTPSHVLVWTSQPSVARQRGVWGLKPLAAGTTRVVQDQWDIVMSGVGHSQAIIFVVHPVLLFVFFGASSSDPDYCHSM